MTRLVKLIGNVLIDLDDISYSYEEESEGKKHGIVVFKSQKEYAYLGDATYHDLLNKVGKEKEHDATGQNG